ncbi:helix-turn-helix transcriptional regulator [Corynebacterium cystitidis]|uniref:Putative transcriptional regulator n=1 Tax=Corynebacterium cystitidis DSM 20524 TaxID=1121357 RepID=A0A1H9P0S8_9CORY|nr:helix-turn-helix transcriptional regulator [Corynebacterium cystitidis]WJY82659.1 anaerobic benzoate catabolism transcriptional regulator [Corynebacterium cystitidis DSM 20524]SER41788.1 putative transcriptional regulator [Corynebacterium cystitidis DSM 20524]SNV72183.1 transcriptional regulator [Corynebacterium cystitidis]
MAQDPSPTTNNMVRQWRRWLELSQQELADAAGVSRQTIANIEKGNYSPSVHLALDICHTLGKTVEEVFGREQDNQ